MLDKPVEHLADWGEASEYFDSIKTTVVKADDLYLANEAQTRFDVIDRLIKEVLGWGYGQISVEEHATPGYIDYNLRVGDASVIVEAKRIGATFPSPTKKRSLKINGSVLSSGEIAAAIVQAEKYALSKGSEVACVTNGLCWCIFSTKESISEDSYATLFFPFDKDGDAEELFNLLSVYKVNAGSTQTVNEKEHHREHRLIDIINDADGRLDRNNIAEHIAPALDKALYSSVLTNDIDALEKCFVTTDGRTKFDSLLNIHLSDSKPLFTKSVKRIKRNKRQTGPLAEIVRQNSSFAPAVTLIIGSVGAGKSTYLKHFEFVSGKDLLAKQNAHWIYIDFEAMGKDGNPRDFLYSSLRSYLASDLPGLDYDSLVKPAYSGLTDSLAKGPLALIKNDKQEFNRRVTDTIQKEYDETEPYVDRLISHLVRNHLCVIVLDNVDLYEDAELETKVFSEGLALSKRVHCNVIVSLRDSTYIKHKDYSTFDAFELKRLWLDPPPFREVLANRLTYSKTILSGHKAKISMDNGIKLDVPDLAVFFDIVQRSVLQNDAGRYIEAVSNHNPRHGLTLISNLLTSGHIQADKALKTYLSDGRKDYSFPFHEVFKGSTLGQWKYFKETRADCINIFDSRLGAKNTRLLRLIILKYLSDKALSEDTIEVRVDKCVEILSECKALPNDIINTLEYLRVKRLIKTVSGEEAKSGESVTITRTGAYYLKQLSGKFAYAEQAMLDTSIDESDKWDELSELTYRIETETGIVDRMELRNQRIDVFIQYLYKLEQSMLKDCSHQNELATVEAISKALLADSENALHKTKRWFS